MTFIVGQMNGRAPPSAGKECHWMMQVIWKIRICLPRTCLWAAGLWDSFVRHICLYMCVIIIMGSYDGVKSEITWPCLLICVQNTANCNKNGCDWFYALIECLKKNCGQMLIVKPFFHHKWNSEPCIYA